MCADSVVEPLASPPPPPTGPRTQAGTGSAGRSGGSRVGHKEEMGRGADSEAAAAGAGPPTRRNEKEEGPSPPQLPPPREAAPTFLQAQDAVWAARDSETLSALPSPRTRSSAPRQPVTAPSSLREVPEPIAPRVGPCLPQAEVEALAPAAAPLQVPRSPSRRQVPQHGLLSPL